MESEVGCRIKAEHPPESAPRHEQLLHAVWGSLPLADSSGTKGEASVS